MWKIAVVPGFLALFVASVVSAQTYYSGYSPSYSGSNYIPGISYPVSLAGSSYSSCVILTTDLSYGSRGTEVSRLQQFLVSQNYPGSGSWMITGYFGAATAQAVRNFQQSAGIPMTGYVDWMTRNAIQMRTCGVGGYPTYPTYPTNPTYPTYPTYPTLPTYPTYPNTCGSYYYNNDCEDIEIDRLRPTSGDVGKTVTIEGSGFTRTGNIVYFDTYPIATVTSSDGEEIRFTVPTYLTYGSQYGQYGQQYGQYGYNYPGYGSVRVEEGETYDVWVKNSFGQSSNSRTFRVTDDDNDDDELTIEVLSGPSTLEENEEGTWRVRVDSPDNRTYTVTADWDDDEDNDSESITGDETVEFEHEYDDEGDYDIRFRVSGHGDSDFELVRVEVEN